MHFTLQYKFSIALFFFILLGLSEARRSSFTSFEPQDDGSVMKTVLVDPLGHGDFTTVQQAIDSIPSNNNKWIRISVKHNVYNEQVTIPPEKTHIFLDGEGRERTIIQWSDSGSGFQNATIAILAQNFVARGIQFKNDFYKHHPGNFTWTTAAYVGADKAAFIDCSFYGVQDTLNDAFGRHYFQSCIIEGMVDFIWGHGQSIYQNCKISINGAPYPGLPGFITAHARDSASDPTGFVFISGSISGSGKAYLGRAYRPYSRVLFYKTSMSDNIVPEGWDAWNNDGHEGNIDFSEVDCIGDGSDKSKRVEWEKKLSPKDVKMLTNPATFINQDGWLRALPKALPLAGLNDY